MSKKKATLRRTCFMQSTGVPQGGKTPYVGAPNRRTRTSRLSRKGRK